MLSLVVPGSHVARLESRLHHQRARLPAHVVGRVAVSCACAHVAGMTVALIAGWIAPLWAGASCLSQLFARGDVARVTVVAELALACALFLVGNGLGVQITHALLRAAYQRALDARDAVR